MLVRSDEFQIMAPSKSIILVSIGTVNNALCKGPLTPPELSWLEDSGSDWQMLDNQGCIREDYDVNRPLLRSTFPEMETSRVQYLLGAGKVQCGIWICQYLQKKVVLLVEEHSGIFICKIPVLKSMADTN
jgi:hypothetical protein